MLDIVIQGIKSSNFGFNYFESGIIKYKWHVSDDLQRAFIRSLIAFIKTLANGVTNGFDE